MSDTLTYQGTEAPTRAQAHTLFAQTMGYVAVTAALFALGAFLGRNLAGGVGIVAFIAAFACLIGMQVAVRRSAQLAVGLLGAFGLLIGLAVAPTIAYYGSMDPRALWQAGGATALFIAGFGAAGYATRRDLTVIARVCFWALVAQPAGHLLQRPPERLEPPHGHRVLAGPFTRQPHRHPDHLLVHIDPGHPRMDDLHGQPPCFPRYWIWARRPRSPRQDQDPVTRARSSNPRYLPGRLQRQSSKQARSAKVERRQRAARPKFHPSAGAPKGA